MKYILQKQIGGSSINIVDHNTPQRQEADAMVTTEQNLALVTYGADCCIIAFWKGNKIGVCHAGWQGYTQGLIKKMAKQFAGGHCFIGPYLHAFEIKKDDAYKQITKYSGTNFIHENSKGIFFDFQMAVRNEIFEIRVAEDPRCTFDTPELASRRRDGAEKSQIQNKVSIWRTGDEYSVLLFRPQDNYDLYFNNLEN